MSAADRDTFRGEEVDAKVTEHNVALLRLKDAERKLSKSEERIRLAQEVARIGTFEWDFQTGIDTWTTELEAMYGLQPGYFPKTHTAWKNLIHPDDRAEAVRRVEQAIETGKPTEAEWRVVWPDGSVHWLAGRWQAFKDDSGKLLRMIGINIDITERKQTEEKLSRQREFLQRVVDNIPVMLVMWDPNLSRFTLNRHAEAVLGWTAATNDGDFMSKVYPEESYRAEVAAYMQSLTPGWHEWIVTTKDGQRVACDWANIRLSDETMIGIGVDLRERKKIEDALRASEGRYRELVQNANSAIIRWQRDGMITFFNEYAQSFFGYNADEVIGRHIGLLLPLEDSTGTDLSGLITDVTEHPERYVHYVNENICRDGRRVWMAWTNKPMYDQSGRVAEILAVGTDITDRKQAGEALQQLSEFPEENPNPVLRCTSDGVLLYANPPARDWLATFDWQAGGPLPTPLRVSVAKVRGQDHAIESEITDPAGRTFRIFGVQPSGEDYINLYGVDRTQRKRAEDALKEMNETLEQRVAERTAEVQNLADQLRALASELSLTEQRERRRLAMILHDHIQQLLVAAQMQLGLFERADRPTLESAVQGVRSIIRDAIDASRSLTVELSPPILHQAGLAAGLGWLANHMHEKHLFKVHVQADHDAAPKDESMRYLLFESVRELLLNAVKHSGVQEAHVAMKRTPEGWTEIVVEDKGGVLIPPRPRPALSITAALVCSASNNAWSTRAGGWRSRVLLDEGRALSCWHP